MGHTPAPWAGAELRADAPLGPGAAQVWTHADVLTQAGEVGWRPSGDGLSPSLGMAHLAPLDAAADVGLTWAAADLRRGVLRAGLSGAWDLDAGAWSVAGVRVGYDDGCMLGMVTADLSPDRALPDLGSQLQLRR